MKRIDFYFDFISPYAYLAFERLPQTLEGLSYQVNYRPVLFAGMLKHHGQLGPAEIAPKRVWTYRQVLWLAREHGIPIKMPAAHPFNSLACLRLAYACARDAGGEKLPNRQICETIFRRLWMTGADAGASAVLDDLTVQLAPQRAPDSPEVKNQLRTETEQAIALGVFGVPTLHADGEMFWGFDALPILRSHLTAEGWVGGADWVQAGHVAVGTTRPQASGYSRENTG